MQCLRQILGNSLCDCHNETNQIRFNHPPSVDEHIHKQRLQLGGGRRRRISVHFSPKPFPPPPFQPILLSVSWIDLLPRAELKQEPFSPQATILQHNTYNILHILHARHTKLRKQVHSCTREVLAEFTQVHRGRPRQWATQRQRRRGIAFSTVPLFLSPHVLLHHSPIPHQVPFLRHMGEREGGMANTAHPSER